jgi:pyroglutamyl-peptidase
MMKILITGFEPFGGSSINPSEQVVRRLREIPFPGLDLATAVLPVESTGAGLALVEAIENTSPGAVLCLGEASHRTVISVERIAVNLMDYGIPDNQGNQVADTPIVSAGPVAYFSTLPVRKILEKMILTGVPAELSLSAGSFLCNQVMYLALHYIAEHHFAIRAGFIHLPSLPEQAAKLNQRTPSMGLETSLQGIVAALSVIIES